MKNTNTLIGIIILIFSAAAFGMSFSYEYYSKFGPGAGFFPRWISSLMILVSVLIIVDSIKKGQKSAGTIFPRGSELASVLTIICSIALFIILAPYTGYNIAGIVMLFLLFIRQFKWYWSLGMSIVTTILLFMVFYQFLKVPLPLNTFGW